MRTNIDIDDKLMRQAMEASEETTKKAAVEKALRLMVRLRAQEGIKKWRGKIKWEGNLAAMREGRFLHWDNQSEGAKQNLDTPFKKEAK